MNQLHALIYVSTVTRPPATEELEQLLERARARNVEHGVTGVLLYRDGNFMQYIEGPVEGMALVYESIKNDPLHYCIVELFRGSIQVREFSIWSMAFRSTNYLGLSDALADDEFLSPSFAPAMGAVPIPRGLLSKFWNRARLPRAF